MPYEISYRLPTHRDTSGVTGSPAIRKVVFLDRPKPSLHEDGSSNRSTPSATSYNLHDLQSETPTETQRGLLTVPVAQKDVSIRLFRVRAMRIALNQTVVGRVGRLKKQWECHYSQQIIEKPAYLQSSIESCMPNNAFGISSQDSIVDEEFADDDHGQ